MDGRLVLQGTASVGLKTSQMTTTCQKNINSIKPVVGALIFARLPVPVGTKSLHVETDVKNLKIDHTSIIGPLFPFSLQQKARDHHGISSATRMSKRNHAWGHPS
jgi:hypothetical protein